MSSRWRRGAVRGPRFYLAALVLLLIGAYLRIVFALCAACAWVKRRFEASRARMADEIREDLWW
jgi:uncharacterized iron-regulated membrane protein